MQEAQVGLKESKPKAANGASLHETIISDAVEWLRRGQAFSLRALPCTCACAYVLLRIRMYVAHMSMFHV